MHGGNVQGLDSRIQAIYLSISTSQEIEAR